jgi:hypothetical protein
MSKPLLIFPKQTQQIPRHKLHPSLPSGLSHPNKEYQVERFERKISNLDTAISNEAIEIYSSIDGLEPERILVFEIKGSIDEFYKAVEKTEGMEFLGESYIDDVDPDEHFLFQQKEGDEIIDLERKVPLRLFLTINNYTALNELKTYWLKYKSGEIFDKGTTKFRILFEQLNDIRNYSVKDRYQDTGIIEYFEERLRLHEDEMFFEIELTFKKDPEYISGVYKRLDDLIIEVGGELIESSHIVIDEIKYHAIIAKAPIDLFHELNENTDIQFFKCEQILFFRPLGQSILNFNNDSPIEIDEDLNKIAKGLTLMDDPIVALLDGFPLQNHSILHDKVIVDDPENIEDDYPSKARLHGTSMASLILYGDLNEENVEPLNRKIYIHPILHPIYNDFNGRFDETIPNERLFIDIIHSSVKRIFDGDSDTGGIAKKVKIINLSIGDLNRQFLHNNSSWARLIDWLSYKYNVLFIVSAGNYIDNLKLELDVEFSSLIKEKKEELLLNSIIKDHYKRKILAPAESVNAITVGAFNSDNFNQEFTTNQSRVNLLERKEQMSPISRIGFGYLRSIKPDILMPGGRQLYRHNPSNNGIFNLDNFSIPPGHKVAYPDMNETNKGLYYTRGTSNSAALASRFGAKIYQVLENLSFETLSIPDRYFPVLIKALLVHGATNETIGRFKDLLGEKFKSKILQYIGHGLVLNQEKVLSSTEQQVTLVGYGELSKDQSQIFELPLPNAISSVPISKQLTITLAWLTPINFSSNKYKKAAFYIDNLTGKNSEEKDINWNEGNLYNYNSSKRGSVQHIKFKGNEADPFIEDSTLQIRVNCREDGFKLTESVKYGIAVTFELLDETDINIYNEIRTRIAEKIKESINI